MVIVGKGAQDYQEYGDPDTGHVQRVSTLATKTSYPDGVCPGQHANGVVRRQPSANSCRCSCSAACCSCREHGTFKPQLQ